MKHEKQDTRGGRSEMERVRAVVKRLRGEGGCPWDREQTLDSLKQYLIEEAYEVIDAVDSGDVSRHREELGDVLLQIVLHAQIRQEKGDFTFADVAGKLADKLVRRHPHVFGDTKVSGTREVLKNWESIKAGEQQPGRHSLVDGIPKHLPALQKAQRVQSRVSRVGFDWTEAEEALAKVEEELGEVKEAVAAGDAAKVEEELGDLLFAVVNLSRFRKVNAEEALAATTSKFMARFREVENRVEEEGRQLRDCTLAEMDAHWERIKSEE